MDHGNRSIRKAGLARALRRRFWPDVRLRYFYWRVMHPGGDYGNFYSDMIDARLARGVPHRTLGTRRWNIAGAPDWTRMEFVDRGKEILPDLALFGLTKDSVCVDYGCGSLRIGQHLIPALAAGHYWGLDVTDRFFRPALAMLPTEMLAQKAPHIGIIDEAVLAELERRPPDFVFSYAVLKHVPPPDLDKFFDRFMRLVGSHTIAVLYFPDAQKFERTGPMSWTHPAERLIEKVLARQGSTSVGITRISEEGTGTRRHPRSVLWITGSGIDRAMPSRLLLPKPQRLHERPACMKASNASL